MIKLQNLGTVNKNKVTIGNLDLWFSYQTIVAFFHPSTGFVCSENMWSKTTGKLLNEIQPNKKLRVNWKTFEKRLDDLLTELHLN